jgi:hypothetical protein
MNRFVVMLLALAGVIPVVPHPWRVRMMSRTRARSPGNLEQLARLRRSEADKVY